jgi:hypothetical protein
MNIAQFSPVSMMNIDSSVFGKVRMLNRLREDDEFGMSSG